MPENIAIAAFILGAVLLLISIIGGKFKIFGAEVSAVVGVTGRTFAGVAGTILIGFGLYSSLPIKAVPEAASSKARPATFLLSRLTCIRPQEPGGQDRVYLRWGKPPRTHFEDTFRAGDRKKVNKIVEAGETVSLYEKDGVIKDGDDDFLGEATVQGHGGTLEFKNPRIGDHLYRLTYEPAS
jgi:hypothetical protein